MSDNAEAGLTPAVEGAPVCVYAVSDIHTDMKGNMEQITSWPPRPDDVLLLAGDISNDMNVLRATFEAVRERFGHVFYCPGNHDLWVHKSDGCKDSIEKLHKVEALCSELGIRTKPGYVAGIYIVPIISWYHTTFDSDPDVVDESLAPVEKSLMDFHFCKWPDGLTALEGSDSVARYMDGLNDEFPGDRAEGPVISFSHFLPRRDLIPEKRTLFYPPLPKAIGSTFLAERVKRLAPNVHVFGHTHYGWDQELDGVRYVQACLAYPRERVERPFSVLNLGPEGAEAMPPLLVYDHAKRKFPAYRGFWSEYYKAHSRTPDDVTWIYRDKRKKPQVLQALRSVVEAGKERVDDASILAQMALAG